MWRRRARVCARRWTSTSTPLLAVTGTSDSDILGRAPAARGLGWGHVRWYSRASTCQFLVEKTRTHSDPEHCGHTAHLDQHE